MTTVKDIYNYIDKIAPFKDQEDYDNSGINIGWGDDEVKAALIAILIDNIGYSHFNTLGRTKCPSTSLLTLLRASCLVR